ncbi:hypothetical protein DOTSEDRAFT_24752 [Dothistroma septosporum NZE10]|uniref:Uncharacterized protein n=1 Tax=Dothistroma septosporum (strain NZE10 / CBS 128990) TaxID=675120 RepID=N1PMY4_DOTSN|nr:hypothetical protein DOTSEDRAFT_24752 [Dothistroma septosporum NZE10]
MSSQQALPKMSHDTHEASPQVIIPKSEASAMRSNPTSEVTRSDAHPDQNTSIQSLPEELLDLILTHVLLNPKPITLREPQERRWAKELSDLRNESPSPRRQRRNRSAPEKRRPAMRKSPLLKILLVCKAFYSTGLKCYFGKNVFRFEDVAHLRGCMARFTKGHRACLRRVWVELEWVDGTPAGRGASLKEISVGEARPMGENPFVGFSRLESVVLSCVHVGAGWYKLASESGARMARAQIEARVREVWGKGKWEFKYPEDWGIFPGR